MAMRASTLPVLALLASLAACSSGGSSRPASAPHGGGAPNAFAGRAPAPFPVIVRPVNVTAIRALHGRVRCAPREMAPGTWVSFDCNPHQPMTRAIPLLLPKTRMGFAPDGGVTGPLPDHVDHRQTGAEGPIKNQQAVGACTAFSLSSAMDHAIRRLGRQDTVAPLHIWSKYAVPAMGIAGDQTVNETIALEQTWPYDPIKACRLLKDPFDGCGAAYDVQPGSGVFDPQLRAEQKSADNQARYRIAAVEQLQTKPVNVQELAAVIAGGDDVWASFWVDGDAWSSRALQNGVLPEYHGNDGSGHAVVLAGYRTVNGAKQFLIHNSWGERWGEGGYGWISESNVQRHLRSAYKVRVVDTQGGGPQPQPPSSGCAQGQVRDLVLGTCAAVCPSGSPPAAGVCLPTIPGYTPPGQQPGPTQPNNCPQGQAPDLMSGQCLPLCPNGAPAIGGMCLPGLPR